MEVSWSLKSLWTIDKPKKASTDIGVILLSVKSRTEGFQHLMDSETERFGWNGQVQSTESGLDSNFLQRLQSIVMHWIKSGVINTFSHTYQNLTGP